MISPSTNTPTSVSTNVKIAYIRLLTIGVRIVPMNGTEIPTSDMPIIDAIGPIAASGTMYPV